ncbi:hypothetical protein D4F06_28090 [Salmonella enterica subsp. enterica serovar Muenchen]|nr:hypothetical protein [Salmonella enterica subsp. enterica serovar Muenchen]EBW7189476.1 hypothetical protein [Salmonella enterica subsp. enterica serovar Muenchen]EBX4463499.1 hypothetical protein [Salmonella enterica subsp. enterica serovar Muenchen]EBY3558088.1 hypothetical protein [Salmonella enterica subsp. enterica serovar Muenchen]
MISQETQCFGDDYIGLMIFFMALKFRKNYVGNCKTHLSLTINTQDMANKFGNLSKTFKNEIFYSG